MKKVLTSYRLTNQQVDEAIQSSCDAIIYIKAIDNCFERQDIQLINAQNLIIEAGWICYEELKNQLEKFNTAIPNSLRFGRYNLSVANIKGLHWVYINEHMLKLCVEKEFGSVVDVKSIDSRGRLRTYIKLIILLLRKKFSAPLSKQPSSLEKRKYTFFINDDEEFYFYLNAIKALGVKNCSVTNLSGFNDKLKGNLRALGIQIIEHSEEVIANVQLGWKDKFKILISDNPFLASNILSSRITCIDKIYKMELIAAFTTDALINNVSESTIEGALMTEVAKAKNLKTFNTQNGLKVAEASNLQTDFDTWFVHDAKMKEILHGSGVPEEQLYVLGHPHEDNVANYTDSGSLNPVLEQIKNKTVITVFTSPAHKEEQVFTLRILSDLLQKRDDVIVLVRRHPADHSSAFKSADHGQIININFDYDISMSKSLFDLLNKTHIAIVYSSAVSYQTRWFNIPCFNYETNEQSILWFMGEKNSHHVRNETELKAQLELILNSEHKKAKVVKNDEYLVANKMCAKIIEECAKK